MVTGLILLVEGAGLLLDKMPHDRDQLFRTQLYLSLGLIGNLN